MSPKIPPAFAKRARTAAVRQAEDEEEIAEQVGEGDADADTPVDEATMCCPKCGHEFPESAGLYDEDAPAPGPVVMDEGSEEFDSDGYGDSGFTSHGSRR